MLKEMDKAKAGRPPKNRLEPPTDLEEKPLTYAEMDIEKHAAHDWQTIAQPPRACGVTL